MQALKKHAIAKLKNAIKEANEALEYLDSQNVEIKILISDPLNIKDDKMPPRLTLFKLVEHIDYLKETEGTDHA